MSVPLLTNFNDLNNYPLAASPKEAFIKDIGRYPDNTEFFSMDLCHHFTSFLKNISNEVCANFTFLSLEEIQKQRLSEKKMTVFILPELNFTIFNLNYDRISQLELSSPYLVAIRNKKNASCAIALQQHFNQTGEPLALLPNLARFYLESEELLNWVLQESIPAPHNAEFEKLFFDPTITRPVESDKLQNHYSTYSSSKSILFDHYPIHLFYKKYFNINLNININEQRLYEFNC